jgi:hypothetical protein
MACPSSGRLQLRLGGDLCHVTWLGGWRAGTTIWCLKLFSVDTALGEAEAVPPGQSGSAVCSRVSSRETARRTNPLFAREKKRTTVAASAQAIAFSSKFELHIPEIGEWLPMTEFAT